MKRRLFLVCLFYCFFRLPIYESIAAIFWQSASYVFFWVLIILIMMYQFFFDQNDIISVLIYMKIFCRFCFVRIVQCVFSYWVLVSLLRGSFDYSLFLLDYYSF